MYSVKITWSHNLKVLNNITHDNWCIFCLEIIHKILNTIIVKLLLLVSYITWTVYVFHCEDGLWYRMHIFLAIWLATLGQWHFVMSLSLNNQFFATSSTAFRHGKDSTTKTFSKPNLLTSCILSFIATRLQILQLQKLQQNWSTAIRNVNHTL